jgi:hypothetical protein
MDLFIRTIGIARATVKIGLANLTRKLVNAALRNMDVEGRHVKNRGRARQQSAAPFCGLP